MKKFTLCLKILPVSILYLFLCAFSTSDVLEEYADFLQKSFTEHYDLSQDGKQLKRYELNITNNGFCRYKRFLNNGKIEYFAFKLSKFKDMDYLGTAVSGKLYLYTKSEDVIVQTYNDKRGDIDSMSTSMVIPLKNVEAEDLNLIREKFDKISQLP